VPQLAALVGSAVHAGLAVYYRDRLVGTPPPATGRPALLTTAIMAAQATLAAELVVVREGGYVVQPQQEASLAGLPARVERVLTKFVEQDPIPAPWTIKGVELEMPRAGHARLDLAVEDEMGPAVLDWKYKGTLDKRYYDKEVARYRHSWQMRHYCWGYGELLGEPVSRYYVGLIVGDPFQVSLLQYDLAPEDQAAWLQSAQRIWTHMDAMKAGREEPWMSPTHETVYGPCEFQDMCLRWRWDENLAQTDYVRRVR
jgi:hypothetical protein